MTESHSPAPDPAPHLEPVPPLSPMSMNQRRQALAVALATEVARGGRVESQTDLNAVIVTGSTPNHTLHLILTLVTCFTWSPVWLVLAIVQKEHRASIRVDEYGQVLRQQLS
ncbi:hypothetical protein NDR87_26515 [Nocardia sp. CDC159]|uniref:Uncharacterized protein n=1 Tax=Nocardia pulmonis TaxID=2951408 RepID=A0A9X2E635_9NOCA|nr:MULTISPECIES: hypothetical protein [Nocardia]MCM6775002.1 hypothetical protein [Nocardia pulmonis]MCM6789933.1 hypothetical protein [Nocardia sp. CDC159]